MPAIAIKLHDGRYRIGSRIVTYRRAQLIAQKAGYRFLSIIDDVTRNMVDYIDLC